MEVKLLCAAVLLVLTLSGINAQSDVCGMVSFNTRIVGGQDAAPGEWPWQVSVESIWLCGGSLINDQWVLTAAHCVQCVSIYGVTVYLGRLTRSGPNPHEQNRTVTHIIRHPQYNSMTHDNDIALVKMSSPVTFTNYVRPVCLAAAGSVYEDGTNTWVTGWGRIQTYMRLPLNKTLQEVEIPIISNSECMKNYTGVTDNMMCAGVSSGGKNICYGDGGGPMVTKTGSRWVQVGVASFIIGGSCALPNAPGGFTRVSRYESWIKSQITSNQPGFRASYSASSSVGPATGVILTVLLSVCILS